MLLERLMQITNDNEINVIMGIIPFFCKIVKIYSRFKKSVKDIRRNITVLSNTYT